MQPKISVIVPVYKVENYLSQCLYSIINQSFSDIEIIVIDEGDKDRCREIIDYFETLDTRIIAVHEKQNGYGNSVNKGFELAKGEYISIIESDDFIERDMFEKLYEQITRFDADIVKSPYYEYRSPGNEEIVPIMKELIETLPVDRAFNVRNYPVMLSTHPSIWAGLYKTEWLKKIGIKFLTKGAYLDIKFRFETLLAAKKICWVNKPFYHWRITNPTSTNAVWNLRAALERWDYIHSYFNDKPEFWAALSEFMLPEENLNLFIRYRNFSCSKEQKRKIKEYQKLYTSETIKNCPYLSNEFKNNLLGNLDFVFIKRVIRKIYSTLRSIKNKIQSVLYRVLFLLGVTSIVLQLISEDNDFFVLPNNICNYLYVILFTLSCVYCFLLNLKKIFRKIKKFLRR